MTTIRTTLYLRKHEARRLMNCSYEIMHIETHHRDTGDESWIVWTRPARPDGHPGERTHLLMATQAGSEQGPALPAVRCGGRTYCQRVSAVNDPGKKSNRSPAAQLRAFDLEDGMHASLGHRRRCRFVFSPIARHQPEGAGFGCVLPPLRQHIRHAMVLRSPVDWPAALRLAARAAGSALA